MLFYIYRHYKRINISDKRKELISDMNLCKKLLKDMLNSPTKIKNLKTVSSLIKRISVLCAEAHFNLPSRYVDYYDTEIISKMLLLTDEIIYIAKKSPSLQHDLWIFERLLSLHNLPRALVDNASCDSSVTSAFHISKQTAMEYILSSKNQ